MKASNIKVTIFVLTFLLFGASAQADLSSELQKRTQEKIAKDEVTQKFDTIKKSLIIKSNVVITEDESAKQIDIGSGVARMSILVKGSKQEICTGGVDINFTTNNVKGSLDCFDQDFNLIGSQKILIKSRNILP